MLNQLQIGISFPKSILSLPGSSCWSRSACCDSSVALRIIMQHCCSGIWSKVFHRNQGFPSGVPPRSASGSLFAVCREVEGDEEDEIG